MAIDLWNLKPGARLQLVCGDVAEVIAPTKDGRWIAIRYSSAPESPELVGTQDLCTEDEIKAVLSRTHGRS